MYLYKVQCNGSKKKKKTDKFLITKISVPDVRSAIQLLRPILTHSVAEIVFLPLEYYEITRGE